MKKAALLGLLLLLVLPSLYAQGGRRAQRLQNRQQQEANRTVYGTADDGTPLRWTVYPAAGPGPHPAVLVIHGGSFKAEPISPRTIQSAKDAAAAGFNAFQVEYRLASRRGITGQKSAGHYPDQINDLKVAVRAARKFPGGNGKVGAIGGSAGGAHDTYLAATGTVGDDRLDAAVSLSGAYDFTEHGVEEQRAFHRLVVSYVGSEDVAALQKASPITYVDAKVAPLFIVASDHDSMPSSQYVDLIKKLDAVGATDFEKVLLPDSHAHAFANWPVVKDRALAFLHKYLDSEKPKS